MQWSGTDRVRLWVRLTLEYHSSLIPELQYRTVYRGPMTRNEQRLVVSVGYMTVQCTSIHVGNDKIHLTSTQNEIQMKFRLRVLTLSLIM